MPAQGTKKHKNKQSKSARRAYRTQFEVGRAAALSPANPYAPMQWLPQDAGAEVDLMVPSGQMCLVKTVGLSGLIRAGVLNHMDSLTTLVSDKFIIEDDDGQPAIDVEKLADDDTTIKDVYDVVNRVVCHVVVQPHIEMVPRINPEDQEVLPGEVGYNTAEPVDKVHRLRRSGVVYIDSVPEEDQMFIFQYVTGGTADLERFRELTDKLLASVDNEQAAGVPTE